MSSLHTRLPPHSVYPTRFFFNSFPQLYFSFYSRARRIVLFRYIDSQYIFRTVCSSTRKRSVGVQEKKYNNKIKCHLNSTYRLVVAVMKRTLLILLRAHEWKVARIGGTFIIIQDELFQFCFPFLPYTCRKLR